ncbi:MAG: hypothetical protein WCA06_18930 [Terrimicrobiaceae bacterium]
MLHKLALGLIFMILADSASIKDISMKNQFLVIKAKCKGSEQAKFEGKDLLLEISITNNQEVEIGFPLEYLQATGPIIRLIDARSRAETYLRTNLADLDLREKFTPVQPGKSVVIEWVISSGELEQFGGPYVDVFAEITAKAEIKMSGKRFDFLGTDTLHIVGEPSGN